MQKSSRIEVPETLTPDLRTGVSELDAQHEYFLALVRACSEHLEPDECSALILEIARYAQSHFAFEETMMSVYEFPGMQEHVASHAVILSTIRDAIATEPVKLARLRLELLRWLSTHIALDDQQLAQFVLACRPRIVATALSV